MTEEDKQTALDYFELLKEEEAENKKRQQQFSISLRKKKMETEKNTGPSREEIKIPKEENQVKFVIEPLSTGKEHDLTSSKS